MADQTAPRLTAPARFISVCVGTLIGAVPAYYINKFLSSLGLVAAVVIIVMAALGGVALLIMRGCPRVVLLGNVVEPVEQSGADLLQPSQLRPVPARRPKGWTVKEPLRVSVVAFLTAFALLAGGVVVYRTCCGTRPTAMIEEPSVSAACKVPAANVCQFEVVGTSVGAYRQAGITMHMLVYPTVPSGGGWYLQRPPVTVDEEGRWRAIAYLGSDVHPASNGDEFEIVALLAKWDAMYQGQRLDSLRPDQVITDLNLIDGHISWSPIVSLKAQKTGG